jgi:hypothetical protein
MAKLSNEEHVTQHIQKLDGSVRDTIQLLREIILSTDTEISEQIKWNNPAFYYNGEMKPFDPKEYKRDMIVFNLHKNRIMLVFPSGAKVKDTSGLLTGSYADGRRIAICNDMDDVKAKESALRNVIKQWLKLVDK